MPEISVIIPSYNRAMLLGRAVASVQMQNFEDIEILIVDDGSKDNSLEVIAELQRDEPRIRLVQHPKNRGEAAARNTGLREARGDFIAFLDSDAREQPAKFGVDKIDRFFLNYIVNFFEKIVVVRMDRIEGNF